LIYYRNNRLQPRRWCYYKNFSMSYIWSKCHS